MQTGEPVVSADYEELSGFPTTNLSEIELTVDLSSDDQNSECGFEQNQMDRENPRHSVMSLGCMATTRRNRRRLHTEGNKTSCRVPPLPRGPPRRQKTHVLFTVPKSPRTDPSDVDVSLVSSRSSSFHDTTAMSSPSSYSARRESCCHRQSRHGSSTENPIELMPLKFTDPRMEEAFVEHLVLILKYRCFFIGLLFAITNVLYWGEEIKDIAWSREYSISFSVVLCMLILSCVVFALLSFTTNPAILFRAQHLLAFLFANICALFLAVSEIRHAQSKDFQGHGASFVFEASFVLIFILVVNGVIPIKSSTLFFSHICILICTAFTLIPIVLDPAEKVFITVRLLRICIVVEGVAVGSYIGWSAEYNHRMLYHNWMSTAGLLKQTEEDANLKKLQASSALESLIMCLKKGVAAIKLFQTSYPSVDLSVLKRLLLRSLTLAANEDLYAAQPHENTASQEDQNMFTAYGLTNMASNKRTNKRKYPISWHSDLRRTTFATGQSFASSFFTQRRISCGSVFMNGARFDSKQNFSEMQKLGLLWNVDLQQVNTEGRVLMEVGMAMLSPYFREKAEPSPKSCKSSNTSIADTGSAEMPSLASVCDFISVPEYSLPNFVAAVEQKYSRTNTYHTAVHASMVIHGTKCMLRMLNMSLRLSTLDEAAILVAALTHDVSHPGRNNAFLINTSHELALTYNDISVLENFHAASTFRILKIRQNNIFVSIPAGEMKQVRARMIEIILATDMAYHFEKISMLRVRKDSPDFNIDNEEDLWLIVKLCVKAADISHAALNWPTHFDWSSRIAEEFYMQGDEEDSLGIAKSPLCDRAAHHSFAKGQQSFLTFVAKPLFAVLMDVSMAEGCRFLLSSIDSNIHKWSIVQNEDGTTERSTLATECVICEETLVTECVISEEFGKENEESEGCERLLRAKSLMGRMRLQKSRCASLQETPNCNCCVAPRNQDFFSNV